MKPEDWASSEIVRNFLGCAGEDTGFLPEEVKTGKDSRSILHCLRFWVCLE